MKKKLAIIGASYLQLPLIERAKSLGIETHVFAWSCNDVGEKVADFFYPISIIEKEQILERCREIGIDGITSIASDTAMLTVNYVAEQLSLIGNTSVCTLSTTNKHAMRLCFQEHGDPSPFSMEVIDPNDIDIDSFSYPVIVKPEDRSGSRGVTKVYRKEDLLAAISNAKELSFNGNALIEEYVDGDEYSVETISWKGKHHILAYTKKYTTGSPSFIETAHLEPAFSADDPRLSGIQDMILHALDSLDIRYGASHSEFKITSKGELYIIEIGSRMGGDCIGSSLVQLSTGIDFVKAVIEIALGIEPDLTSYISESSAIRYVFEQRDIDDLEKIRNDKDITIVQEENIKLPTNKVTDSSSRSGFYVLHAKDKKSLLRYFT